MIITTENKAMNITLDGSELTTKNQLMNKMKEALSFPDYFGKNWDALEEVLKDFSWINGVESIRITFENSSEILSSEAEYDRQVFKDIVNSTVEYWKEENGILRFFAEYDS